MHHVVMSQGLPNGILHCTYCAESSDNPFANVGNGILLAIAKLSSLIDKPVARFCWGPLIVEMLFGPDHLMNFSRDSFFHHGELCGAGHPE